MTQLCTSCLREKPVLFAGFDRNARKVFRDAHGRRWYGTLEAPICNRCNAKEWRLTKAKTPRWLRAWRVRRTEVGRGLDAQMA